MDIVTRFAPSPTGFLHIGGARTALFNWLFAQHFRGVFRLRIEDTDAQRSTHDSTESILKGLAWLGLDPHGEVVFQSQSRDRHKQVAYALLEEGHAYRCYCTPEDLEAMRRTARAEKRTVGYDGRWRDRDPREAPSDLPFVLRLKMPREGSTVIDDQIQGRVVMDNGNLDDFVLLRADGTPTYMLSVVVDDHDMGVTHVLRGNDHMTNTFRQHHIFRAMDWRCPTFAHLPLIHGTDGARLSKRHGAVSVEAYREEGILPEALVNYLLRLGWSHGDHDIISRQQATEWFSLDAVGASPARFDREKLLHLNAHYLREMENEELWPLLLKERSVPEEAKDSLMQGLDGLKKRSKTLVELAESASFYWQKPTLSPRAARFLTDESRALLRAMVEPLSKAPWEEEELEKTFRGIAQEKNVKLSSLAQPLRAVLTGSHISPGIFEVMACLGRQETLERLQEGSRGLP